ncbi:hypothetical protein [Bacillus sp. E214]|uniref:hypothetical protein n=1 Tax=Bacillus sp. E214 TaxID=2587156 RepID=UPI0011E05121|nr:hypothetical protein [Bacillus sp. E214]
METDLLTLNINELMPLFTSSYTIPIEYRNAVRLAINKYTNRPTGYSDEKLKELVDKEMSPLDTFKYLSEDKPHRINQWKGHLAEWIVCYEYNSIRNSNSNVVFTIVNPDTTSKADILHIVNTGHGYMCVAGPDVKTGNANYLINQLEKVWGHEENIPFFDYNCILQTRRKLSPGQNKRLSNLEEKYPNKKILTPSISRQDINKFSGKFFRCVAGQERGPNAAAIKKAKINAKFMSTKRRSWHEFNMETLVNELKIEQMKKEIADKVAMLEESQSITINETEKKEKKLETQGFKEKLASGVTSLKKWSKRSSILSYIREHQAEILSDVAITLVKESIRGRSGKSSTDSKMKDIVEKGIVSTETTIEYPNRESPITHDVKGHYRNGTYVKPYKRGGK